MILKHRLNKALLALALGLALTAMTSRGSASVLPQKSYQYKAIVLKEARWYWGADANVALFAGQFEQESAWNNDAKSWVGARGLGQFMPKTAADVNQRYPDLQALEMWSPLWSIRALYIYDLELYNGIKPMGGKALHDCNRYAMMLSAYNGGAGWVTRDRKLAAQNGKDPDIWWGNTELYSKRAPQYIKENRGYPRRIMLRNAKIYLANGYPGVDVCLNYPTTQIKQPEPPVVSSTPSPQPIEPTLPQFNSGSSANWPWLGWWRYSAV
jgi:hypothetical protein